MAAELALSGRQLQIIEQCPIPSRGSATTSERLGVNGKDRQHLGLRVAQLYWPFPILIGLGIELIAIGTFNAWVHLLLDSTHPFSACLVVSSGLNAHQPFESVRILIADVLLSKDGLQDNSNASRELGLATADDGQKTALHSAGGQRFKDRAAAEAFQGECTRSLPLWPFQELDVPGVRVLVAECSCDRLEVYRAPRSGSDQRNTVLACPGPFVNLYAYPFPLIALDYQEINSPRDEVKEGFCSEAYELPRITGALRVKMLHLRRHRPYQ
ncbi:hypothetical protein AC578_5681 [Pseudocercospora eumusae]|uniref:Uncharacterized protein n=1 Tax=Pseudocercospora eumusae TaxID=321146 RepID=A0A139H3D6_9PEZI|nr:hypothetical protein AC578_5681 [Pseudocercospora eumusae]